MVPHHFQSPQWNSCVCESRHQPRLLSNGNVLIFEHALVPAQESHRRTYWRVKECDVISCYENRTGGWKYRVQPEVSIISHWILKLCWFDADVSCGKGAEPGWTYWRSARENRLHPDDGVMETRDYREYYSLFSHKERKHSRRRGALTVLFNGDIRVKVDLACFSLFLVMPL